MGEIVTTTAAPIVPAHVPVELVRSFDIGYRGPLDELFPRLDALRDDGRVVWLEAAMQVQPSGPATGAWFFTTMEDVRACYQDSELWGQFRHPLFPALLPTTLDPPDHMRYRRLMTPLFAPAAVATMEEAITVRMEGIVERLVDKGACDFVADVSMEFPTRVFTSWMGLPEEETARFVMMSETIIHGTREEQPAVLAELVKVLNGIIDDRLANPRDDLVSDVVQFRLDGEPLAKEDLFSICYQLFLGGLDTVANALSFSFAELARHPEERHAMLSGEVETAQVVEEMLRCFAFTQQPRVARRDGEFAGVHVKAGDLAIASGAMASRDPSEYDDPTHTHLERTTNRHFAFGAGPHRCLGSHLARLEMRIALDVWHARIPEYRLDGEPMAFGGPVMGLSSLPLRWD
jgi:cytochrome P450